MEVKKMSHKRTQYNAQFKFKAAMEAAKGLKTINQIGSELGVHPNQVSGWKKQLLEQGPTVFASQSNRKEREQVAKEAELYEQIGRLKGWRIVIRRAVQTKQGALAANAEVGMVQFNHHPFSLS
jgi:transposase